MKHINLIIIALAAVLLSSCHTTREVTQEEIAQHNHAVELLNSQHFLVKIDRLVLDKRNFPSVTSNTNFILVEGDKAIVQVSPALGGGPNGVGGFTVKGNVSGFQVDTRSNGSVVMKFNVTAAVGSCSVFLNLPKNGVSATANINNTMHGKNATAYGTITDIDDSYHVGNTRF